MYPDQTGDGSAAEPTTEIAPVRPSISASPSRYRQIPEMITTRITDVG